MGLAVRGTEDGCLWWRRSRLRSISYALYCPGWKLRDFQGGVLGFLQPLPEGAKFLTVFGVYGRRFGSFLSLSSSRLGASKPQSGANRPVESSGLMRWPGRSLRWPVGIGIGCSRHCHGNNSLWPPQGHTVRLGSRSRAMG